MRASVGGCKALSDSENEGERSYDLTLGARGVTGLLITASA